MVAAFLVATVALGARGARNGGDRTDDFLLAGRRLTLPAFVVTLVSTWYGGVLGVGENSYLHGLSNWLVLGLPYYVGAALFALLFAGRAREMGQYTIPDLLFGTYGRAAGILGTVVVLALSLPAAYILMLGVIVRRAVGIGQAAAVLAAAAFCVVYVVLRGFRSVVQTKGLQFALMYGGFLILLPAAILSGGDLTWVRARVPAEAFTPLGGQSAGYVFAWYLIALQTLVEPTFFQRCFAARSPRVARVGIFVSIGFFALFDALTTFTGLYARALLPDLASPVDAFPALAELLLPAVLLGVFYAGMIATVMSTVDSFLFVGAVTIGRDLVWRLRGDRCDQTRWTRWGLLVAAALSTAIALGSSSVVSLWYGFGSVGTVVLLPPLLGAFFPRIRPSATAATGGMLASGTVALTWLGSGWLSPDGRPWLGIEPIYPGLAVAIVFHVSGVALARRRASRHTIGRCEPPSPRRS